MIAGKITATLAGKVGVPAPELSHPNTGWLPTWNESGRPAVYVALGVCEVTGIAKAPAGTAADVVHVCAVPAVLVITNVCPERSEVESGRARGIEVSAPPAAAICEARVSTERITRTARVNVLCGGSREAATICAPLRR